MRALLVFMYGMVTAFILIVTIMTGSRLLAAEQRNTGIYKALGFTSSQLRLSFALRFGMTATLGGILGLALAAVVTDPLVSSTMKLAGISNFTSAPTWNSTLLPIVVVIGLFTLFAYLAASKIKRADLTVLISE